ncbi:hypothetical protein DFH29DRAFT_1071949 [Suillus ampliporus]|nr:hypothetical protein DFH29DRAFT_1071949 [Suillus ampliporus]
MQDFGTPSRVRGDRGGENLDVATHMIMRNGPRRASFMWGSSTRNSRIEAFISQDCSDFQAEWNCHPIRGPDTNDKSPKDLRFLGQIQFGVYHDDCKGIHPDVIEEYYGVYGNTMTRRQHQTGAGHPIDEEDSDNKEEPPNMTQAITDEQRHHIHHEAIHVPLQRDPFISDKTHQQFFVTLAEVVAEDITPCDCRLTADEWENDEYLIFETIPLPVESRFRLFLLKSQSFLHLFHWCHCYCMDPASESNTVNQDVFCRGVKAGSQPCDCEEFFAQSQDKGHCIECGHGRSKHPHKASGYEPEIQEDADEQPPSHPSSSVTIKDIFTRITGGKTVNDNSKSSATGKRGSLPLAAAREEALSTLSSTRLAGYQKLAKGPAPSAGLRKDRKETTTLQLFGSQARQNTTSSTTTAGNVFRVASVAMLTCGVDRNGLVRVSKAPSKNGTNEIQAMKNRGCYLEQQFIIESGWTYRKIFEYLDVQLERRQPVTLRSSCEDKPIWRLLNKSGQTLTVVDIGFPTGNDLVKHKGRDKASVSDCHLWFVTRNRIPDDIYESWNTQPIVAGSDSERDDCSDCDVLLSNTDSPDDSVGFKSDNELASSLMELDMTSDTDVKDLKGKGKMKAALVRSPTRSQNAKHSHTLLSPSPSEATTRRAAQKKLRVKKESASDAIPLFLMNSESTNSQLEPPPSTQPARSNTSSHETVSFRTSRVAVPANELSSPPDFVSVSEADVLWRNKIQDDDPFAPEFTYMISLVTLQTLFGMLNVSLTERWLDAIELFMPAPGDPGGSSANTQPSKVVLQRSHLDTKDVCPIIKLPTARPRKRGGSSSTQTRSRKRRNS